jgi:drug/metabolite transporter (DMT)-like permease
MSLQTDTKTLSPRPSQGPSSDPRPGSASRAGIWAGLFAVYIAWGGTYLAIRYAVETLPPFLMAAARFLIAGAVLYVLRRVRGDAAPTLREWRSATIIGIFLLVGGNGGVVWAEQWVPSGLAAVLVSTTPLWMASWDLLRPRGPRPGRPAILGILIGFAGVIYLIGPAGTAGTDRIDPAGTAALILAALCWSIGSLYSRGAPLPASPLLATALEMLAGGAGLLVVGFLLGEPTRWDAVRVSTPSLWGLAYLIVFGSWLGFAAYTWLLRVAPTPMVSTYAYVNPLVAIFLGRIIADERITSRTPVATAVILAAVALITITPSPSADAGRTRPKTNTRP